MHRYLKTVLSLDSLVKPTNGAAAVVGAFLSPFLGSGKFWAYALFFAIIIADWISGTEAARRTDSYQSKYGLSAAPRTLMLLWLPFIGWLLDKVSAMVFGIYQPGIAYYSLTFMLAYHSWVSMTANCYRAGWSKWIPRKVLDFVASEIKAKAERAMAMKPEGRK